MPAAVRGRHVPKKTPSRTTLTNRLINWIGWPETFMAAHSSPTLPNDVAQLQLLHRLEDGLQRLQHALLKPDAHEILGLSAEQHELCGALKALFLEDKSHHQIHILSPDVKQAFDRVLHLNRVNAALLRRSRRSLEIFSCLLTSLAATYTVPKNSLQPVAFRARNPGRLQPPAAGPGSAGLGSAGPTRPTGKK